MIVHTVQTLASDPMMGLSPVRRQSQLMARQQPSYSQSPVADVAFGTTPRSPYGFLSRRPFFRGPLGYIGLLLLTAFVGADKSGMTTPKPTQPKPVAKTPALLGVEQADQDLKFIPMLSGALDPKKPKSLKDQFGDMAAGGPDKQKVEELTLRFMERATDHLTEHFPAGGNVLAKGGYKDVFNALKPDQKKAVTEWVLDASANGTEKELPQFKTLFNRLVSDTFPDLTPPMGGAVDPLAQAQRRATRNAYLSAVTQIVDGVDKARKDFEDEQQKETDKATAATEADAQQKRILSYTAMAMAILGLLSIFVQSSAALGKRKTDDHLIRGNHRDQIQP